MGLPMGVFLHCEWGREWEGACGGAGGEDIIYLRKLMNGFQNYYVVIWLSIVNLCTNLACADMPQLQNLC